MDDADLDLLLALADEAEEEPAPAKQQVRQPAPAPQRRDTAAQEIHPTRNLSLPRSTSMPSGPMASASAARMPTAQPAPRAHSQPSRQVTDGFLDRTSGFRVSKPLIGSLVLKDRLTDDCVYLNLKDISPFRENAGRWATMAVLVSKVQASGRDGTPYGRWTLSDLAGKQVTLFLWRSAASEHYKEPEGSLLLLWSPQVRRDEGGGGSGGGGAGFSLHIDKPEMLQRPGMSADFGLCRGTRKDGQRCTMPINKSNCEYCPYHAQAALRALSSNRSDMAGANLLQRQLLPQARAAQKQIASTTGKPMGGINALIARPPPPKLAAARGGGVGGGGGGGTGGSAASAVAAAAAAGTGAYGVSTDSSSGGGADVAVGGKRSYGAQLLANLQERQAALEEGAEWGSAPGAGPGPGQNSEATRARGTGSAGAVGAVRSSTAVAQAPWGRRRTRGEATAVQLRPMGRYRGLRPVNATKARAIAAARATGQLGRPPSDAGSGGGSGARATTPAAAAAAAAGEGAARRPTSSAALKIAKPPPLPAHLASLLKPPAADGGATPPTARPPAGAPAGCARSAAGNADVSAHARPAQRKAQTGPAELGAARTPVSARGSAAGGGTAGAGENVSGGGIGSREGTPRGGGGEGGLGDAANEEEDLLLLEDEDEEEHAEEAEVGGAAAAASTRAAGDQGSGGVSSCGRSQEHTEEAVALRPRKLQEAGGQGQQLVQQGRQPGSAAEQEARGDEPAAAGDETAAAAAGGGGSRGSAGASGSGGDGGADCGGGDEGCGLDELLEIFPELQDEQAEEEAEDEQPTAGNEGGSRLSGPSGQQPGGGAAGGGSGARAGSAGAPAAVATGLLPRVAGLSAPASVKAAEARKQQAAVVKARNEKLKALGMKSASSAAATVAATAPKPLGAANVPGRLANGGAAAAAALAISKGLPMPRAGARAAAAAAAAAPSAAAAGPSSALAAAFGSLVQQLPTVGAESRYTELSEEAAGEAVLSMLEGLEAKDALVQQLDSISHLKVTVWHCAQCNRLSEFLDKQCRSEGHTLSKTTTLKRFWTCDHCNARITTLGVRFPANRCSRCNNPSLEFTACTMYRGPRELKPAGMAAASGLASKENLFATIEQHPVMGHRTFR